jgi:hypothetical protein
MDKQTYCNTLAAELRQLSFQIDALRRRMPTESGSDRVHDAGELAILERRRRMLADRLDHARTMGDSLWGRIKAEWEEDWAELWGAAYQFRKPQH